MTTISIVSPQLSPSLNEYGPATMTDENSHVIPALAIFLPDASGNTGSSPLTIDEGNVSQVTDRKGPPLAHTIDGHRIPVYSLVSLDSSGNVIPFALKSAITSLTGEASASGPGAATTTLSNPAVIGKILTSYTPTVGAVLATDSIIQGIQKVDGNSKLQIKNRRATAISTTLAATDYLIAVTDTSAVRTVTLPLASSFTLPTGTIQEFEIKDESGAAATNNITIAATGPNTIDGAASVAISANYGVSKIYTNGVTWFTK